MHNLQGNWVGCISGTNNADIFIEMQQNNETLSGVARINDRVFGMAVYRFTGKIADAKVIMDMTPETSPKIATASVYVNNRPVTVQIPTVNLGQVKAEGTVSEKTISGKWSSTVGTGGPFSVTKTTPMKQPLDKTATPQINQAFIMMSIAPENPELEDILSATKRVSKEIGVECIRVDEIEHTGKITDLILEYINTSKYLICEISTERPNVYYELGYAHGRGKEVVLIARQGSNIHFDIKDYNIIYYRNITELEDRLSKRIAAIQEKNKEMA